MGLACGQASMLILSVLLLLGAIGLYSASVISPAWQVVDIREFFSQHQHGLWLDCARYEHHLTGRRFTDKKPLHCTYKFDYHAAQIIDELDENIDENSAVGEAENHQFKAWHFAVLVMLGLAITLGILAIFVAMCTPCFRPLAIVFAVLVFACLILSIGSAGTFFVSAHSVSNRFVKGLVGTYEQQVGFAFYLLLGSILTTFLSFVMAILSAYLIVYKSQSNRPTEIVDNRNVYSRGSCKKDPLLTDHHSYDYNWPRETSA